MQQHVHKWLMNLVWKVEITENQNLLPLFLCKIDFQSMFVFMHFEEHKLLYTLPHPEPSHPIQYIHL